MEEAYTLVHDWLTSPLHSATLNYPSMENVLGMKTGKTNGQLKETKTKYRKKRAEFKICLVYFVFWLEAPSGAK